MRLPLQKAFALTRAQVKEKLAGPVNHLAIDALGRSSGVASGKTYCCELEKPVMKKGMWVNPPVSPFILVHPHSKHRASPLRSLRTLCLT